VMGGEGSGWGSRWGRCSERDANGI